MNTPDLLIMRHGQTTWNLAGRMQGQKDSPLTNLGRDQAAQLGTLLSGVELGPDYSAWVSPLGRAQATAQVALKGHFDDWHSDPRLMELSVGPAAGMTRDEAFEIYPHLADQAQPIGWQFLVPGGESFDEFRDRVGSWLAEVDRPAVIICHGITSRMIRAICLGLGQEGLADLPGGQGVIHRINRGIAEIIS